MDDLYLNDEKTKRSELRGATLADFDMKATLGVCVCVCVCVMACLVSECVCVCVLSLGGFECCISCMPSAEA
jgi:hypothetical protein